MRAVALLCVLGTACAAPRGPHAWPQVVALELDHETDGSRFVFSDPAAWACREGALELVGPSNYEPPQRSPRAIALLADHVVGDFVLEVEALQTGRDYGHRDLCFFFGFQSPERFYYAHLAPAPDPNAHNVFLVDNAPRKNLAPVAEHGVDWGESVWHQIRIERHGKEIRVDFDGKQVLSATDATLTEGRVGLGSFDDTGRFRRFRLYAPRAHPSNTTSPWPAARQSPRG